MSDVDLTIPADMVRAMHDATADAVLSAGAAFGIGGSVWHVTRTSGRDTQTIATSARADITGAIVREQYDIQQLAAAGQDAPSGVWRLYARTGQDLQAGDILTSAADSTLTFNLIDLDLDDGYLVGTVKPTR